MNLRQHFKNEVSSSAFLVIDEETRIVGKYSQISLTDSGHFDIWLVGPNLEPLSPRKLNSILKSIQQEASFTVLTGEAYTQTMDKQLILRNLPLLGIKKKRKISISERQRITHQLRKAS